MSDRMMEHLRMQQEGEFERKRSVFSVLAIVVALLAAVFTGWQGWEARSARIDSDRAAEIARKGAREEAEKARSDAELAAKQVQANSERLFRIQTDQAYIAAKNADRSAKAAEQTARTLEKTLELGQRPWVGVEARLMSIEESASPIQFQVRTTGGSPALNLRVEGKCVITDNAGLVQTPEAEVMSGLFTDYIGSAAMIPGAIREYRCRPVQTRPRAPDSIALFAGVVRYDDVFGRHHETRFCFRSSAPMSEMGPCERGNSAN